MIHLSAVHTASQSVPIPWNHRLEWIIGCRVSSDMDAIGNKQDGFAPTSQSRINIITNKLAIDEYLLNYWTRG